MNLAEARALLQEGFLGARLVWKLATSLGKTIRPDEARTILRRRLERRETDFLDLAGKCIYDHQENPYRKLLKNAGCEYGDLRHLVKREGVESALQVLFRQGVYLTSKEFRGDGETVRGNMRFMVNSRQLRNPLAKQHLPIRSSGSRSHGTRVARGLDFVRDNTLALVLFLEARKSLCAETAIWSVPGGVVLSSLVKLNWAGSHPVHWFSQLDARRQDLSPRYRLSARVLGLSGLLAGVSMPRPEYVSLEDPLPIVRWMKECLQKRKIPHLFTFSSSAVRLAQCAFDAGIELPGAKITISGEPVTRARMDSVRRCHAEALPAMGCVETGHVGYGCLTPEAPDDMHLLKDLHAVIQPGELNENPDLVADALLFTTLRLSSPLILLNVSLGDQAVLERRTCGCLLGSLGLDTHLHSVRSFEKLTSGGMALLDAEIVRVLEEELPKRFGGGPTDYQLLEDEHDDGRLNIRLVVHPRVGNLEEDNVKEMFLRLVASDSGADTLTSLLWRDADAVSIERSIPRATATGKIQHLHADRKPRRNPPKKAE
jgi:hypothetical protein